MAHFPVNHHLRPLYRVLAGLCGLYVLVFGIVAFTRHGHVGIFAQRDVPAALGLHANPAFAMLSIVVGAILFAGAVIGRNVDRWINLVGALVFLVAGMLMLTLLRTSLNVLGFTVATCVVSLVIGMVLLTAGLYGQVGSPDKERDEEGFRHGTATDPQHHVLIGVRPPRSGLPPFHTDGDGEP
jgi:hypothetical protein